MPPSFHPIGGRAMPGQRLGNPLAGSPSFRIREVLVVHTSHTDIGYTHLQPAVWELHARYIDRAIDLCEASADRPEGQRFCWTCEVTEPLDYWLARASSRQIERFRACVARRQIDASAFRVHYTPLIGAAALARSLRPLSRLRSELGLPLRTAISHDINGLPWPVVGLLLDAGVEMLIAGSNIVFGGSPLQRPLVFRWQGPCGREIITLNAEHYNLFSRLAVGPDKVVGEVTETALQEYFEQRLPPGIWPFDFAYMVATYSYCADNNGPDPSLLRTVARWAECGLQPVIRLAQPDDVLDRVLAANAELPVYGGDWTDYWSFGCASSIVETALNRGTRSSLHASSLLRTTCGAAREESEEMAERALDEAALWEEHTWCAFGTATKPYQEQSIGQWVLKAGLAWNARARANLLLRDQLEAAAGPQDSDELGGILVFNPSHIARREPLYLPDTIIGSLPVASSLVQESRVVREGESASHRPRWRHIEAHVHKLDQTSEPEDSPGAWTEPVEVAPFSVRRIPAAMIRMAPAPAPLDLSGGLVSGHHLRLRLDPSDGRIISLAPSDSPDSPWLRAGEWPVFSYVRETAEEANPDAPNRGREVFYNIDWDDIHADRSGWKTEWRAKREGASRLIHQEGRTTARGQVLEQRWEAPGVSSLLQRITLLADRPAALFEAEFEMQPTLTPEGIYFVFPLVLGEGWRAHFDTADTSVELDADQLSGANCGYPMVHRWACVHQPGRAVVLTCPDAPLVGFGGFHFGRHLAAVPRPADPLLVDWVANNYWTTNFPACQPGLKRVRYEIAFLPDYEPAAVSRSAVPLTEPMYWHPVMSPCAEEQTQLLSVEPPEVRLLELRREAGLVKAMVVNESTRAISPRLSLPGRCAIELLESEPLLPRAIREITEER